MSAEERGQSGLVARVWNLAFSRSELSLRWSLGAIRRAVRVSHIETNLGDATVTDGALHASLAPPQEMQTFRLYVT